MAHRPNPVTRAEGFTAKGEIVEILEQDGERRVKVMLSQPPVLDLSSHGLREIHLGDQVLIEGSLSVGSLRPTLAGPPLPDTAPHRQEPTPTRRKTSRRG